MLIREKKCIFAPEMKILFILLLHAYYFVCFTDKAGSEGYALSEAALARRAHYGIALDELDKPVSALYLDSIRHAGGRLIHRSRWMNGATVEMPDSLAEAMQTWSFVSGIEKTRHGESAPTTSPTPRGATNPNLETYNLQPLHTLGYKGQGKFISVIDVGFPAVDTAVCYDSLRREGRLVGKYDFATTRVAMDSMIADHGTNCLSILAAQLPTFTGAAPQARYVLMRTEEYEAESPKEGDNWIVAVEMSDSLGVDIISSSLGYYAFDDSSFNYDYAHLDGTSYRPSRAATIAARKGILVCVAAGNSGNDAHWPWVNVPGDADSILTVGAVQADSTRAAFSSYGPTVDGRTKPEVLALGARTAMISPPTGQIRVSNGTSFSCPLIAGLAACLWSALPEANAMEIRERIIRSADHYTTPTDDYGYGIPNGWLAYQQESATALTECPTINRQTRKLVLNGSVYIQLNGESYTLLGERVQ